MNDTAQETTAVMTLLVEHEHVITSAVEKQQKKLITQNNYTVNNAGTNLYIPALQHRLAGFGLHPLTVHTALILPSGSRPESHL